MIKIVDRITQMTSHRQNGLSFHLAEDPLRTYGEFVEARCGALPPKAPDLIHTRQPQQRSTNEPD